MAGISGKLLRVKIGDEYLRCQLDATLTLSTTYEEEEGCKPDLAEPDSGQWVQRDAADATQDWTLSVSARAFLEELAGASLHQGDILKLIVDGNLSVDVEFLSTPGQHSYGADFIFEGAGLIESFTFNAPVDGKATYDLDIVGNGKPSVSTIPAA